MAITDVTIPTPDGEADGVVAVPDGDGQHPGVLLYMDIFGLRPTLREMAETLADQGHVVLVPNVFFREGRAPLVPLPDFIDDDTRPGVVSQLLPLLREHDGERVRRDAAAYLDFLADRPEVADGPLATIGYCFGGVLALRTAAAEPERVGAVAAFHPGNLATDAPDSPHTQFASMRAAVHLGHADGDMDAAGLSRVQEALDASGLDATSEVYPGAAHGFTMADTSAFDADALQRHWDRLRALLP